MSAAERVLDRATNTKGQLIRPSLERRLMPDEGESIEDTADGIILLGLPRSGKSTLLGDIIELAKKKGFIVDLLQHEDTLDRTEVLLGQQALKRQIMQDAGIEGEAYPRRLWDQDDYRFYSDNFLEDILTQEQRCALLQARGKRVLRAVEAFGVNPEDEHSFDRGLSALTRYADILKQRGQFRTLFEGVAQDPGALRKGTLVQTAAAGVEDLTKIKKVLARWPRNLLVRGIGNSEQAGHMIQKTILAWASPKRAEDASNEVYEAAREWVARHPEKLEEIVLPPISQAVLQGPDRMKYRINAAYMGDLLERRIGVPEGWREVVLSAVDPRLKVPWNISPFIRKKVA